MRSRKKIKVALVSAPYRSYDNYRQKFGGKHPTNGIRILAGELLRHQLATEVKIFDGAFYPSSNQLINDIRLFRPDVLGIPGYTDTIPEAISIFKSFKDVRVKISGGPYTTARPEELLKYVDVTFLGEAELSLREFFELLNNKGLDLNQSDLNKIRGIAYQKDDQVIINQGAPLVFDLDSISVNGWKLVADNIDKYRIAHYRYLYDEFISIMSSRGCDKSCIYCASNMMHGLGIRFRSAGSIREEIDLVNEIRINRGLPKLRSIKFDDDDILARDINELEKLFSLLADYQLTFTGFASFKAATEEKIRLAAAAGMKSVFFGIETHEINRKIVGKGNLTDVEITEKLNLCRKYGVRTSAGYIIGFPFETLEDIYKTITAMELLPVDFPSMNILTIHPGTPLWFWQQSNSAKYKDLRDEPFIKVDRKRWADEPSGLPCPHPFISKRQLSLMKTEAYQRAYTNQLRIERLKIMAKDAWETKKTLLAIGDYLNPS